MPIPRSVARFNRRYWNKLVLRIAGHLPWFGIVNHTGRNSGRPYRTPVNVFSADGEYIIALTYTEESDWVKNVLASGRCDLETRGQTIRLINPRLVTDRTNWWAPLPVRLVLNTIRVSRHMRLSPVPDRTGPQLT